ncbi:hypothetical protein [Helicobacter marmotae]|uniref:hypothetical protein n=1 Tax=Helicobacter marmotae TaxID=152490 RepID=UPI001473AD83|nr:hypothetical protein [Helicobacter marmotae]
MPPLKASSGWGIYKGEGATSQFKPLPLIEKEKRESLANPLVWHHEGRRSLTEETLFDSPEILQVCHSERSEESLNESLVAHRDSSVVSLPQNDNSGRVSSNSNRDSSPAMQALDMTTNPAFTKNPKSNASP